MPTEFTRGYPETTQLNLYSPNFLTVIEISELMRKDIHENRFIYKYI